MNGFIVPLQTLSNSSYVTLALFYNQSVNQKTPSMVDYLRNITPDADAIKYTFYQYLAGINNTAPLLNNVTFKGCSYAVNQTCTWVFKPSAQSYYFFETATYPYQNVSIDYIPASGLSEFNLFGSESSLTMLSKGANENKCNATSSAPYFAVINASIYSLLSYNGMAAYKNGYACGYGNLAMPFTNNKATISIYTPNVPYISTSFYLTPAYTQQYTNSTPFYNTTPITPAITLPCGFKYKKLFSNLNWTFSYGTSALWNYSMGMNPYIKGNVGWMLLNFTHMAGMGACSNLQIGLNDSAGSMSTYGTIPYAVYNCSPSRVSLLISNTTSTGYVYNSLYLLFNGSRQADTPSLLNSFRTIYLNGTDNTTTVPNFAYLKFMSPLNTKSYIIESGYDNGCTSPNSHLMVGRLLSDYIRFWLDPILNILAYNLTIHNLYNDKSDLLIVQKAYYMDNISAISNNGTELSNTYSSTRTNYRIGCGGGNYANLRIFINQTGQQITRINAPFSVTENYSLTADFVPVCQSPTTTIPPNPIVLPNETGSLIPSSPTNDSVFGNASRLIHSLSGSVILFNIRLPLLFLFFIAILEVILIIFAFTTNNEWIVLFVLLVVNFSGLIAMFAISGGAGFLLIGLIAAGYYVIKNSHKWFKHG